MRWLFKPIGNIDWILGPILILVVLYLIFSEVFRPSALCTARQGVAQHLIENLETAAKSYQIDWGVYPPGTGNGSAELVKCLKSKGPKNLPYYEFLPDMLDEKGNVVNPVFPSEDGPERIIHYRNNAQPGGVTMPPVHRERSFDLWCAGCNYPHRPEFAWEVNNWE